MEGHDSGSAAHGVEPEPVSIPGHGKREVLDAMGAWQGVPVVCLEPTREGPWSGGIVLVEATLHDGSAIIDRAIVGLHLSIEVPRLRSWRDIREFAERHVVPLGGMFVEQARQHLASRWRAAMAESQAFRQVSTLTSPQTAGGSSGRTPAQPSLFGRYGPMRSAITLSSGHDNARCSEPRSKDEPDVGASVAPDDRSVESMNLGLIILRPGPGRPPAA
jgi:hypothetical protein